MKICLIDYTDIGIHEPRGRKIAKTLAERGHEVLWICGEEKGKESLPGVKVVCLKQRQFLPFRLKELFFIRAVPKQFKKLDKDFNAKVILGYSHVGAITARRIYKLTKIPYVVDYPDPFYTRDALYNAPFSKRIVTAIASKFEGEAMRDSKAIATIGQKFVNELIEDYNVNASKIVIIPNAPDASLFYPARSKAKKLTIVYSGKAILEYGLENMLEGFSKAYVVNKNLQLLLIVKIEPKDKIWLENKIKQLFISKSVILLENVPYEEMPAQLRKAQVAIYPYPRSNIHDYAMPNKLLEYLAAGLPIIANKMPVTEELLEKNHAGILVEGLKPEELAEAILKLAKNKNLLSTMSKKARQLALEKFDWNKHIKVYEELLKGAIK